MSKGGGGGSPAGNTTTITKADPWAGQQPYLSDIFANAGNWYRNGGTQVAPFNPLQTGSQTGVANLANTGANGLLPNSTGMLNSFLSGSMLNSNPYLDAMANAADNSITRNYQNVVAPGISSNFEANGRYGSGAMSNAMSQANQDLATQLGNTNANLYGNAYQQGLGQMLQASALAPSVISSNLGLLGSENQMGGQQQAQQQALNQQPLTNLQNYANLIGSPVAGGSSTSFPYFQNNTANALGGALGGAMLGNTLFGTGGALAGMGISAGMGSGLGAGLGLLLSDRSTKEGIRRIGTLDNGLPIYSFRYKGHSTTHIGVMADEVKQIKPHAVVNIGGTDFVNYGEVA